MNISILSIFVILVALSLGSFIKGTTGQGLPQVAIPVIATILGVETAVVVMAIPGIVTNSWLIWNYRNEFDQTRDLPVLLTTGAVGTVLGSIALKSIDADVLSLILAGMIVGYAVVFFAHPHLRLRPELTRVTSPPVGLAAGLLQGTTGMSGPIISTYLHGFRLDKAVYVVSITTIFQIFALAQAATFGAVGLYTAERLTLSLISLIPVMLVLPLGTRVADRLSRRTFDVVVIFVLLASATKLVYDALG